MTLENKINLLIDKKIIKEEETKDILLMYNSYTIFESSLNDKSLSRKYSQIYMNKNGLCHNKFAKYWILFNFKDL